MRDRPDVVLARHFFTSLFQLGFLSDKGTESLKRALLGALAIAMALGLLLVRVFIKKYGMFSTAAPDVYARAVLADHAFLIAVPMWFVAGAVGLVGHSLFPDQTDFRILGAEPLSRWTIFSSKLAALLLFVGLFVAGAHLALVPLTALTLIGAAKTGSWLAATLSFAFSSLIGSFFAALFVVAVHGLLVLFAPRARLLAFSSTVRSVFIGLLVLSLPLVGRLPATAAAFATDAWWLPWTPPTWFVGLQRWLMGDGRYARLAGEAAVATILVLMVSIASYAVLYRRFDRVMVQPATSLGGSRSRSLSRWSGRAPVRHAIRRFVSITIRRSVLHQGLIVGLLAAAGGFVLNGLLNANGWNEPLDLSLRSPFILTILWAPMTLMVFAIPSLRLALSVPLDLRSNWIFRMTEDVAGRAEIAAANVRLVLALGVLLPLALIGPVQWWVLGPAAAGLIVLEALIGWLGVEGVMAGWRRIPFTCSYIPGKGFLPGMLLKAFAAYVVLTTGTTIVLRFSLARPRVALVVALVTAACAGTLSLRRRRQSPRDSLLFDDELPAEINPLSLNAD